MTITMIHLLSFATFFRSYTPFFPVGLCDVVMNWEARVTSVELISLKSCCFVWAIQHCEFETSPEIHEVSYLY